MGAMEGQIIVGDHVMTPTGREAIVKGRSGEDRPALEYVDAKSPDDAVTLPERLLYLIARPKLRRPR